MPDVLLSPSFISRHGDDALAAAPREYALNLLPFDDAHPPAGLHGVQAAFMSLDMLPSVRGNADYLQAFFGALQRAPNLRWLHVGIAGTDMPALLELARRGVTITSSSGANADAVAQQAIAGMLALARRVPDWVLAQKEHRWQPYRRDQVPADVNGSTAVIVGLGEIGRRIARICRAMDMRVIGVRRHASPDENCDEVVAPERLHEIAPDTQWLFLACPLTTQTRNLAGAELLARLPAECRIVNVGRGGVLDEEALLAALRERRLAGAYLDVFDAEPLPVDSPLWDAPELLISPHVGGASRGFAGRGADLFIDNLRRYTRGEALRNLARFEA
ncbi:D-2-hydroxyacid dehydrogenase [Verticiella sediminum]|uniref:D-2-hydroxyacid dehydrogenase n=1 Tax=Verticiella sediminum TaxID=1247510 RepID=A0A556AJE7_9BURK|nr:D-2-hydroxyacid dehydrogenase [Verticiella sediminum]TSH93022.1 D-2-hydroxyacid dehydrogenase [Verticiella sediminum]